MATGLQYKENLTMLSTGYPGEGVGSNGLVQDWTDAVTLSGSTSTTYFYHDSVQQTDANSTRVDVSITDNWSATINRRTNTITVNVASILDAIRRYREGNPGALSTSMFLRRTKEGANLWTSGGCVDATVDATYVTGLDLGSTTITLAPGDTKAYGTVYLRSNVCGHDSDPSPSIYVDEFLLGVNFRNILPMPTTYSLNYDANGGTGAPATQTDTTGEGSCSFVVSSTQPTWGYYRFLGWSRTRHEESCTDADVEYRAGDTITLSEANPSLTLYAVWMKDYRPGASLDTNTGVWKSHDRTNGACHVLSNVSTPTWKECRTIGGEVNARGNAPSILHAANANSWYNQKRLGKVD